MGRLGPLSNRRLNAELSVLSELELKLHLFIFFQRRFKPNQNNVIAMRFKHNLAARRHVDGLNRPHLHHAILLNMDVQLGALCNSGRYADQLVGFT
jgi:hypothetical protein